MPRASRQIVVAVAFATIVLGACGGQQTTERTETPARDSVERCTNAGLATTSNELASSMLELAERHERLAGIEVERDASGVPIVSFHREVEWIPGECPANTKCPAEAVFGERGIVLDVWAYGPDSPRVASALPEMVVEPLDVAWTVNGPGTDAIRADVEALLRRLAHERECRRE